jgi:hypothetical protein
MALDCLLSLSSATIVHVESDTRSIHGCLIAFYPAPILCFHEPD